MGEVDEIRQNSDRLTFDYLGNIRTLFGAEQQFSSDLSFGTQIVTIRTDQISAIGTGIPTNEARNVNAAAERSGNGNFSENRVGRLPRPVAGGHLDRRFLQLGARVDQNSAFGRDADAFFLPKVGFSWVISEEPFFEGLTSVHPDDAPARRVGHDGPLADAGRLAGDVQPLAVRADRVDPAQRCGAAQPRQPRTASGARRGVRGWASMRSS
jgi:hypothetical protein